jgi:hypothetical protein
MAAKIKAVTNAYVAGRRMKSDADDASSDKKTLGWHRKSKQRPNQSVPYPGRDTTQNYYCLDCSYCELCVRDPDWKTQEERHCICDRHLVMYKVHETWRCPSSQQGGAQNPQSTAGASQYPTEHQSGGSFAHNPPHLSHTAPQRGEQSWDGHTQSREWSSSMSPPLSPPAAQYQPNQFQNRGPFQYPAQYDQNQYSNSNSTQYPVQHTSHAGYSSTAPPARRYQTDSYPQYGGDQEPRPGPMARGATWGYTEEPESASASCGSCGGVLDR